MFDRESLHWPEIHLLVLQLLRLNYWAVSGRKGGNYEPNILHVCISTFSCKY